MAPRPARTRARADSRRVWQARTLVGLRAVLCTALGDWRAERASLSHGADVLVTTLSKLQAPRRSMVPSPHGLTRGRSPQAHLHPRTETPSLRADGVRALVLDDAEAVYEAPSQLAGWRQLLQLIPDECAVAMATPFIGRSLAAKAPVYVPGIEIVEGRGLHTTRPEVHTTVVRCSKGAYRGYASGYAGGYGSGTRGALEALKVGALHEVMGHRLERRTVVVCNDNRGAEQVSEALRDRFAQLSPRRAPIVLGLHDGLSAADRARALKVFLRPVGEGAQQRPGPPRVLVASARAVRGLELGDAEPGCRRRPIEHIVLYDTPPHGGAYIRRLGLATRADRPPARVTILATDGQIPFARAMLRHDTEGSTISE